MTAPAPPSPTPMPRPMPPPVSSAPPPPAPPPPAPPRPHGSRRAQVLRIVSWVGLGTSCLTFLASLPALVHQGGAGNVALGALESAWIVGVLLVALAPGRTAGPLALIGSFLGGYLGTVSLAVLVGRPVVDHFGGDSPVAASVWGPLTEEVLKLVPVTILVLVGRRIRPGRPPVVDAVLIGTVVAAGFALHENALYGRGTEGGWFANPPFSVLFPTLRTATDGARTMLEGGHIVYTALTALGLAVTVGYWHRHRVARLAAPLAFLVVLGEHATVNRLGLAAGSVTPPWTKVGYLLSLGGYLSTVLLCGGLATVAVLEWRGARRRKRVPAK